jgi:AcrR family transcriptional regulator
MRTEQVPATGRRAVTREKLLVAGLRLFSKVGVDATTIQQITDEAGVGFGSFYNHFESKQALVEALIESYLAENDWVRQSPDLRSLDIAELICAWFRYVLERAKAAPDWGTFFSRTSNLMVAGRKGYFRALGSDIRRGMKSGRFKVNDFDVTLFAIAGANLMCLLATLDGEIKRDEASRVAAFSLSCLGIDADEAREIAHRPLPAPMLQVLASIRR